MRIEADVVAMPAALRGRRVGVVDVGSNSIRLVVYEGDGRAPLPIFNEKVLCGLARGLEATGRLDPDGVALALENLVRFAELARVMGVARLEAVATAAVRDAANGAEFVAEAARRCNWPVRVLTGAEEAELSALGVVAAIPEADGVIGDIGGGSLEVVALERGELDGQATLPLGPFRLMGASEREGLEPGAIVERSLSGLPWLERGKDRSLYLVGGSWRELARIHMAQSGYPLHVIHHYTLSCSETESLAGVVSGLSRKTIKGIPRVADRRREVLPLAALVLERLLVAVRPARVVFCAFGLREGLLYKQLDPQLRRRDPLIDACAALAERAGEAPEYGFAVDAWLSPLFEGEVPEERRLRLAACLIADLAARAHPDYRADHAYRQALTLPVVGIDHPGRAYLALAASTRFAGKAGRFDQGWVESLLDEGQRRRARAVGAAVALAESLCGKVPELLRQTSLERGEGTLTLGLRAGATPLLGEALRRKLEALAQALALRPRLGPRAAG